MRLIRLAVAFTVVAFLGGTEADAGKRSRRVCCPTPVCQPTPACCPQPAMPCQVCTPVATCCAPQPASATPPATMLYPGEICPQFSAMNWGSYCSYYAITCDSGSPVVMLDAACGIYQQACTGSPNPFCASGSFLLRGTDNLFKHTHHDKAGHEPRQQRNRKYDDPIDYVTDPKILEIVRLDAKDVGRIGFFQVIDQGNQPKTVHVQLRRFSITPQPGQLYEGKTTILQTGQQIDELPANSGEVAVDLDKLGKVEFNGGSNPHVVYVTLGGIEYQVIMAEPVKKP